MDSSNSPALLIVGHGSRDPEGVAEFLRLAGHLRGRFPDRLCEIGFLEFARPTIEEGVRALMDRGVRQITAVPGMLMAARHAKNDVPFELNTLAAMCSGVEIRYGAELGVDAALLRLAAARIEAAEAELPPGRREETLLVVVGRGASDPDANGNVAKITRMLWEGMGFGWAETCFIGVTRPLLEETLGRVRGLGFSRMIVFPYFLFTGRLVKKIYRQADEFAATHPGLALAKAHYLDDAEEVVDALAERVRQAEEGSGVMNCLLCQYRERIVGFEAHQGEPQVGHHFHVRGAGVDGHGPHHHHHHPHPHEE